MIQVAGEGTLAGHQWMSPNRRYTFVAFEGPGQALPSSIIGRASSQASHIPGAAARMVSTTLPRRAIRRAATTEAILVGRIPSDEPPPQLAAAAPRLVRRRARYQARYSRSSSRSSSVRSANSAAPTLGPGSESLSPGNT